METYEQNMGYPPEAEQNSETSAPVNTGQRRDVGAAAAGTVALGAAAYALSRMDDSDDASGDGSDGSLSNLNDGSGLNDGSNANNGSGSSSLVQPVALTDANANANAGKEGADGNLNLDDMTFEEAFAAARQAQGPGHHFTWHGGLYNTFYQEELDKMSMTDRLAFVETLGLPDDSDDNESAPVRRAVSEGSHRAQPTSRRQEETPVLADNDVTQPPAPSVEPMTVVPIAAVSNTNSEVVPLSADSNADNADLLMAETNTEHSGMIQPSISSVDDQSHGTDDNHLSASDDDHEVHFAY